MSRPTERGEPVRRPGDRVAEPRADEPWGPLRDDHPFALCLTHDVDRPYKTYQSLYYGFKRRDLGELRQFLTRENSHWQFDHLMALEADLGVRSAFYVLNEQRLFRDRPPRDWFSTDGWKLYTGRYSLDDPAIVDAIHDLDDGGWEVGLHGSYESYLDGDRLAAEKQALESVLGHEVVGGRQHYLNLEVPETWRRHVDAGLRYDASLGSSSTYGFPHGHGLVRPFDDAFVVFPLTLMEAALPDPATDPAAAWEVCEQLLEEARDHRAVMTVLWHPKFFSDRDFPGHTDLYRRLVERALEMGAWVGPPGELYGTLEHPEPVVEVV